MNTKLLCLILATALILSMFAGCQPSQAQVYIPQDKIEGSELFVNKVENLPEDFIMGMDASSVLAQEASGVKYYNFEGQEQDVFQTLAESGVNYIRVRVWNDPFDAAGHGYGGGNCTIDTALEIGHRANRYGMKLLVNFHYSDFWADPGKQMVPKAWADMAIEEKTDALYNYTKESLQKLKDEGIDVGMVQIGNETNGAMCGETVWFNIQYLLQAGSKAAREIYPEALVAVHFANPEKTGSYENYASKLDYYDVDYDVFGSSYYPYWHGTLENLQAVLSGIQEKYGKKVLVLETSYAYTAEDSDFNGNTVSDSSLVTKAYPYTVHGQARAVRDVIEAVNSIGGIGVFYWEGTWNSVGTVSYEENQEKWEKFGSGWATSYAAEYDPDDAGKYFGGCAVENQALFDAAGKPLESLRIFNLVRYGNAPTPKADAPEDTVITSDIGDPITLPETVNAIMADGNTTAVPVSWDITREKLEEMAQTGGKYEITGTADGMTAKAYLTVAEFNYLENFSFETGNLTGWTLEDLSKADELHVEDKVTDSLSGTHNMHFWSANQNTVHFTLEQNVTELPGGRYKFSISIMGGDSGEAEVYAYVKLNGQIVATAPMEITSYGNWDTALIAGIEYTEGDRLTVGISVKCQGAGNGAWGKIDDAMLNKDAQ